MSTTYTAISQPASSHGQPQWDQESYGRHLRNQRSQEFYRHENASSQQSLSSRGSRKGSVDAGTARNTTDPSPWIHRDKLAQIESREMAEAGVHVRGQSRQQAAAYDYDGQAAPGAYMSDAEEYAAPNDNEFERIELDAGDDGLPMQYREGRNSQQYGRHSNKPNASRIPVSRNSPAPVSNFFTEREAPLSRSRKNSLARQSSPEDGPPYHQRLRPHSQNMAGQMASEDSAIPRPRTPHSRPVSAQLSPSPKHYGTSPSSSANKARTPAPYPAGKKNPAVSRAVSSSTPKSRNASTASNTASPNDTHRPRTSSGRAPHPINRPDGEAPWLATMYKPDPMLPPDQQILPTHAKRMMQQDQWRGGDRAEEEEEEDVGRTDSLGGGRNGNRSRNAQRDQNADAVSYTHLTLPTKRIV